MFERGRNLHEVVGARRVLQGRLQERHKSTKTVHLSLVLYPDITILNLGSVFLVRVAGLVVVSFDQILCTTFFSCKATQDGASSGQRSRKRTCLKETTCEGILPCLMDILCRFKARRRKLRRASSKKRKRSGARGRVSNKFKQHFNRIMI